MLKKVVLLCTVLFLTMTAAPARTPASGHVPTMKEVFLAMPDGILPLLTRDNRADFIDFLASKMTAKVRNVYEEESVMDTLTADYTHIRLSPASEASLKLLPVNDSTRVVCLVHTYRADASDSRVSFYTTDWKPLPQQAFLIPPSTADFLPDAAGSDTLQHVKSCLDAAMIVARLSASGTDLTFTYDTSYLPREEKKLVSGYIRPVLVQRWENGKFVSR